MSRPVRRISAEQYAETLKYWVRGTRLWYHGLRGCLPERIIAVARGGIIPAARLWYHLCTTVDAARLNPPRLYCLPPRPQNPFWNHGWLAQGNLLIVDDLFDTGSTRLELEDLPMTAPYCSSVAIDRFDGISGLRLRTFYGVVYPGQHWLEFPHEAEDGVDIIDETDEEAN